MRGYHRLQVGCVEDANAPRPRRDARLGKGALPPLHPPTGWFRMAIFSLHHAAIGRSTHRAGTAGAHAAYVLRQTAARVVIGQEIGCFCTTPRKGVFQNLRADGQINQNIEL